MAQFSLNPDTVADAISCEPKKPMMINMSFTPEFDKETSVNVPAPYQPLRFDVNACSIEKIGKSVGAYLRAMQSKGCLCKGTVLNINSHGDVRGDKHLTDCLETIENKQTNKKLNSQKLILELQAQMKANNCEESVTTVDSCFSSKVIEDLRSDVLSYPVVTSAHSKCTAPGNSNLWTSYAEWCERCDEDRDSTLSAMELKSCIPKGKPELKEMFTRTGHQLPTMSVVVGPWALTYSKNYNEATPVFRCPQRSLKQTPKNPSYYQGLQGRDRIQQQSDSH